MYGMPFAHLFQDVRGRSKWLAEYQNGEKEDQQWESERQDGMGSTNIPKKRTKRVICIHSQLIMICKLDINESSEVTQVTSAQIRRVHA